MWSCPWLEHTEASKLLKPERCTTSWVWICHSMHVQWLQPTWRGRRTKYVLRDSLEWDTYSVMKVTHFPYKHGKIRFYSDAILSWCDTCKKVLCMYAFACSSSTVNLPWLWKVEHVAMKNLSYMSYGGTHRLPAWELTFGHRTWVIK